MSDGMTSRGVFGPDFGGERMWGLQELPFPEPVAYWPQTTGWYVALGILLLGLMALVWWRWRVWKRNAWRREMLTRLDAIAADPKRLTELPFLLRRSALNAAPRHEVASLRGQDWILWLNRSAGGEVFTPTDAGFIDDLPYRSSPDGLIGDRDAAHLIDASRIWIRSHRA